MNPELLPPWLRPGTRAASVVIGIGFAVWYLVDPPSNKDKDWPGTAAAVLATLLVALILAEPFKVAGMKRRDAWPAALTLLMAVVSLLLAVRSAAYGTGFSLAVGAIVIGSTTAMAWLALTGVLDALIRRAGEDDQAG
jgi:hypothetical protein